MIYLIFGSNSVIDREIDNLINKSGVTKDYVYKYDLVDGSILDVIENLDTFNMFGDKKLVVCRNINKLDNEEKFINYLNNPSDNILILSSNDKFDERKKVFKLLMDKCNKIEVNNDMFSYIKDCFKDYTINFRTIRLLEEYTLGDYNRLNNEIEKLREYASISKEIKFEDVEELVTKDISSNVFNLIDNLNNKKKMFEIYDELLLLGEDEVKLLNILAGNFRLIYQVKLLSKNHNSKEIATILKKNPYAVTKALEKSYNYSESELLNILKRLSLIDISIKSGNKNIKVEFPIFLATIGL